MYEAATIDPIIQTSKQGAMTFSKNALQDALYVSFENFLVLFICPTIGKVKPRRAYARRGRMLPKRLKRLFRCDRIDDRHEAVDRGEKRDFGK